MARAFFPGENPLGKRLRHPDDPQWREIIGVVRDARPAFTLRLSESVYQMYRAYAQDPSATLELALRAQAAPETLAPTIRRIVANLHPEQPIEGVELVRHELGDVVRNTALVGWMLGAFATLGLLLAALGLYAVIANTVVQRTREIGIRMAVGARAPDVLALVLGQGLRITLIGIGLGLAGSFATAHALRAVAPALAAMDIPGLTFVVALLIAVAALACFIPAHRATKVDPIIALRAD
jgi:cell division protein FtsX